MATAQDIVDDIKSDLTLIGTDYDNQLLRAIQSALRQLRGKRYWFLKAFGTDTGVAGTQSLTLTSTLGSFSVIGTAEIVASGSRYGQDYGFDLLTFSELRKQYWNIDPITTGRPLAYAVEDNTMWLSHICDVNYSLEIDYHRQDEDLPTLGDSSIWFDDGYDVVRSMAQYIFKRDAQGMIASEADSDMVTMALLNLDNTHTTKVSGRGY